VLPMPPALPSSPASAPPWQEEAARARLRTRPSPAQPDGEAAPAPEAKPRRNLLFSSSSRRERERAAAAPDLSGARSGSTSASASEPAAGVPEAGPRSTFEDAWPASEPVRSEPYRRSTRTPPPGDGPTAPADRSAIVSPPRTEDPSEVTVLKSGVVDGMAYSLYSDGSIEAQLPEGMMRFASIGELRAHLDQRP
jgi:hypothetical protein